MIISKGLIKEQLIDALETKILAAKKAYEESKSYAQEDDLKSESKWDTRSIEASYLASAQEKRVRELEQDLRLLKSLDIRGFEPDEEITVGAIVKLEEQDKLYFITPVTGGQTFKIRGHEIQIISTKSPMGQALLGLMEGDDFKFESPSGSIEYLIESVY